MSVAIVSGAAGGLGRAFVRRLSEAGHSVLAFDVDDRVAKIDGATALVADVSESRDVARVVDAAAALGEVRILVNNAASWRRTPVSNSWAQALDDWDYIMDANLKGVLLLSRATVPHLQRAGGGHVINVSSTLVLPVRDDPSNDPDTDLYNASKWALNGFTDSWARSLKAQKIKVNGLCLSLVDTPLLKSLHPEGRLPAGVLPPDEVARLLLDVINSGRSGENIGAWMGEPARLGEPPPLHQRITG